MTFALLVAAACDTEETSLPADDTSSSSQGSSAGGSFSVASTVTSGAGASGGNPNLSCFGSYTTIPTGACDMLKQDCPVGYGCEAVPGNGGYTTDCVLNTAVKGAGDPCVSHNSCRAGLYCVFNKCSPVCCPSSNEPCGVGGLCNVDTPFGAFRAQTCSYLESCTLFTDDCGDSANCYPLMDDGNSVCAPLSGGTVGEGQSCGAINECDNSMVCSGGTCRWACYLDGAGLAPGAGGCPMGQSCVMTGLNPPQNVGVCQ